MSAKPTPADCLRKIAPPKKGWRWLVDEKTKRGDRFICRFPKICGPVKKHFYGMHTDGPTVDDQKGGKYSVSGYIRRTDK